MRKKDLDEARDILKVSEHFEKNAVPYDPRMQMEESLSAFLTHRLDKLNEDQEFEKEIKAVLSSKISEAKFGELMQLLNIIQSNNNFGVQNILSPFIPRVGDRVPLLDDPQRKEKEQSAEQKIGDSQGKELLEAFQELSNVLGKAKKEATEEE